MIRLITLLLLTVSGTTMTGLVEVVGAFPAPEVTLTTTTGTVTLVGDLTRELARTQSFQVEVSGSIEDGKLMVSEYRILDIGGGKKPIVGTVVAIKNEVALQDGGGQPIVLSLSPRGKKRLRDNVGAKIWVAGDLQVSGQLKVGRYGVLRKAPKRADKEQN